MAELATLQADAANVIVRNADSLRTQAGLDSRASMALGQAARLQTFLEVLTHLMSSDFAPITAEVHITDK